MDIFNLAQRNTKRTLIPYVLAILLPLALCIVRLGFTEFFGTRPMLVMFMLPVIISALLGGLRPGLLATIISAILGDYYFTEPIQSLYIFKSSDLVQILFFIISGFLVSILSEMMRRSFAKEIDFHGSYHDLQTNLQLSESKFKAIFEQAAVGIAMVDNVGNWLAVNEKLCELLGYSRNELLTRNFQQLTYPQDLDSDLLLMNKLLSGEITKYELEKRYLDKRRNVIWALLTVSLVRKNDNTPDYFISIIQDISERKSAEKLLLESEKNLKQAQEIAKIGRWEWDVKTNTHKWSDEIFNIYGREKSLGPAIYPEVSQYFTKSSWRELSQNVERALDENISYSIDAEVNRPDGGRRWITATGEATHDENGELMYMHGTVQDITERKMAELQLQVWGNAFKHAGFALAISNAVTNTFIAVNPTFAKERGYLEEELVGKSIFTVFPSNIHERLKKSLTEIDSIGHGIRESTHLRKDGSTFPVIIDLTSTRNSYGQVESRLAYVIDISEQIESKELIYKLSNFDSLTNLPNRYAFNNYLTQTLSTPHDRLSHYALVLINIDRFKNLNDAQGHNIGDRLLILFANRLQELLNPNEILARLGGDEFGIILKHDVDLNSELPLVNRVSSLMESIQAPYFLNENDNIYISASIGVTLFFADASDKAEDIFKRADTALLTAQNEGGNRAVFFELEMTEQLEQNFQINKELHTVAQSNQLKLFLQSQVDCTGKLVGAEALIRWIHPDKGLITPNEFIPIAEESDIIIELGDWMLNKVCQTLLLEELKNLNFRIALNISPRHFRHENFLDWVEDTISKYGINPHQLTFEVTENLIIKNVDDVSSKMKALTKMGIRISIDDFGTGYSSLSYLKKLPIHELKIDKIFIQDAPSDPDDAALVETIFTVAKQLKLDVVAEGVENKEQVNFLNSRGEFVQQGYFYGRPEFVDDWIIKNFN